MQPQETSTNPWHIFRAAFLVLYEELFHLLLMGTLTTLSMLLPVLLAFWLLSQLHATPSPLLFVSLPLLASLPGTVTLGGLWAAAYTAVQGDGITWSLYWKGIRDYGGRAISCTTLQIVGYLILASNLLFYTSPLSPLPADLIPWIIPLWFGIALLWSVSGFYWLSFQFEMAPPRLLLALRNSLYMSLMYPFNAALWLLSLLPLSLLILILPPLIILMPSWIAVLSLTALQAQLVPVRGKLKAAREIDKTEV